MNKTIESMLQASEGRHLTKAERQALLDLSAALPKRLTAVEEIAAKEAEMVSKTLSEVMRQYADFTERYPRGKEAGHRDISLVLRYCAQAIVRGDPDFLRDRLLTWLNTILRGVGLAPTFIRDVYTALISQSEASLSPATHQVLRPHIEVVIRELTQDERREVA